MTRTKLTLLALLGLSMNGLFASSDEDPIQKTSLDPATFALNPAAFASRILGKSQNLRPQIASHRKRPKKLPFANPASTTVPAMVRAQQPSEPSAAAAQQAAVMPTVQQPSEPFVAAAANAEAQEADLMRTAQQSSQPSAAAAATAETKSSWWSPSSLWDTVKATGSNLLAMAQKSASELKSLKDANALRKASVRGYNELTKSLTKMDTAKMQAAVTAMREAANPKLSCEDRQAKRLEAYGSLDQLESPLNIIFGKMSKQGVFKDGQLAKILKAGKLETEAGQVTAFGQQLNALIEQAKQELKTNPVAKESFFNRLFGLTKSKSLPAESAAAARPLSDEDDSDKEEPDMVDKGLEMIEQIVALQADLPTLFAAVQSDPGNPEKLEKLATLLLGKESIIMHLLVNFGGEKGKAIQENLALVYSYIDFILREKQVLEKACSAPVTAKKKS